MEEQNTADVAAPENIVEKTYEACLEDLRVGLDRFGIVKAAHDVAKAAVDDVAKEVQRLQADANAVWAKANDTAQKLSDDFAKVKAWADGVVEAVKTEL